MLKALQEYDRRLIDLPKDTLLNLVREVIFPRRVLKLLTQTYVRVKGQIIPVEVLMLLDGVEVGTKQHRNR
ncbi:MAG: hypothetical protein R2880_13275 [Deinococcales bacterium]